MKKTLLLSAMILLASIAVNAQTTKIWNLGGDPTLATNGSPAFPVTAGIGNGTGTTGNPAFPVIINGLGITGISTNTNMGAVNASVKTFTSPTTSVAYSFVNRFQNNGAGYSGAAATDATPTANMPIQRYISFNVSGPSAIYVLGVSGSSSSTTRAIFLSDGTNYYGSIVFPDATNITEGKINYTGSSAATLYLYSNASLNLYLISATNVAATAVNQVLSDKGVSFNGTEITNSKGLALEVYNVLGKRVASSMTSIPTTNFQKGVYIVRAAGSIDSLKICI